MSDEKERELEDCREAVEQLHEEKKELESVTKELLEYEANVDLETALEMEAMAQARCMETPDFIEGYNAFIEKRPLRFNRS